MAIIKWEPFGDFDRFFSDASFPVTAFPKISWDLAVDMFEEKGNIIARMTVPGMDVEKIDVRVEDGYLHISGARDEEKEEKGKHYYSKEIRSGSFERVIHLPKAVDKDKVTAEYDKGVLKVTMPVLVEKGAQSVRVEVKK